MPDLIRHPKHIEVTGFRLPPERQNMHFLTFYETVNSGPLTLGNSKTYGKPSHKN